MRVNCITNFNGCGLQRDVELLRPVLQSFGHEVRCAQFTNGQGAAHGDINIFMEVIVPNLFRYAPRQFIFVNPEWFPPEFKAHLPHFEKVFCKTADAERVFSKIVGTGRCVNTGFFARDMFDPNETPKLREFLHVAGKSQTKNTQAIVDCWLQAQVEHKITIVSEMYPDTTNRNIVFRRRIDERELKMLMNRTWFHLMPSQYEGYGHSMHESMSCGAVVITTNGPPMNEFEGICRDVMVHPARTQQHYSGVLQICQPGHILAAVKAAMALPDEKLAEIGAEARKAFEAEKPRFVEKIRNFFPADVSQRPGAA